MLDTLRRYIKLWKASKNYKHDLDALLAQANPTASLQERLVWLVDLMHWVRHNSAFHEYKEVENVRLPSARIKFLFMVLDRNPQWKEKVALTLRSVLRDVRAVDLFSETGLSSEPSFWAEFKNRFINKVMPDKPLSDGMSELFSALFPSSDDVVWVASLDPQLVSKIIEFISNPGSLPARSNSQIQSDIEEALLVLTSQVRAIGLSPALRKRMEISDIRSLPFFRFTLEVETLLSSYHSQDFEAYDLNVKSFRNLIWKCMDSFNDVYRHLDKHGVNTSVVFALESSQAKLKRIDDLITLLVFDRVDPEMLIYFLSQLIEENQDRRSLWSLFEQNTRLISRKIVERSAETGSHYITQNKEEYISMLKKAMGGGAYTAFTVVIKLMTSVLKLPLFMEGFAYSLNYAVSFCAIQLSGFTLATKQPAMTGPAIAAKLQHIDTGESVEVLVDEIVKLIRSQFVGILGNVFAVIPVALIIDVIYLVMTGHHIVNDPQKAEYIFNSTNVFGPALIYAAFTGILLWASSITAGYIDNWFFLNRMKAVITYNRRLNFVFGSDRCKKIADYLERNISGLAANISLGFYLGMTPAVMSFLGIFLDVRHVTLSSGTFALGVAYYGKAAFEMKEFWFAFVGIGLIGLLNVGVSFALAFFVAVKSRNTKALQRRAIYLSVLMRLRREPLSFIFPKNSNASNHADKDRSNGNS